MRRATIMALCCCLSVLLAPEALAAKRVAFVVGIDAYDNLPAQEQLKKAVNDAHALGEALKGLGYQVVSADNADRRGFNESWQKFLSAVEPGDEAAFFFAGHGVEIAGQNYLLPRDVPKPQSGEASLVKNESLSVTQLLGDLQEKGPRVSLVILDACRDNPFAADGTRSVGGTRGLARVDAPEGTFVMYSAGAGQTALDRLSDSDDNADSVFTRSLVPLLKTPGLGLQEVALKVREEVVALAKSAGFKQTPAYYDQVIGRFCVAGCEGDSAAAAPVAPPTERPSDSATPAQGASPSPAPGKQKLVVVVPPKPAATQPVSQRIVVNFDALSALGKTSGVGDKQLADYLARFGIKLTASTAQRIAAFDDRDVYAGKAIKASSGRGVFMQQGGNPVSYTLEFATPLKSISFDRVALIAGPNGVTHPTWNAVAQDAAGATVATVNEDEIRSFSDVPSRTFTLSGAGIRRLVVSSDNRGFAAFSSLVLDQLVLVTE